MHLLVLFSKGRRLALVSLADLPQDVALLDFQVGPLSPAVLQDLET